LGLTPSADWGPKCRSCSLLSLCRPKLGGKSTSRYLRELFRPGSPQEAPAGSR
jgi:hypothetical protein